MKHTTTSYPLPAMASRSSYMVSLPSSPAMALNTALACSLDGHDMFDALKEKPKEAYQLFTKLQKMIDLSKFRTLADDKSKWL